MGPERGTTGRARGTGVGITIDANRVYLFDVKERSSDTERKVHPSSVKNTSVGNAPTRFFARKIGPPRRAIAS